MSDDTSWRDDPLTTAAQDTLGTAHVARRMAKLIEETHSFESSTVVGLAGPWGSGKSSVIAMCLEELRGRAAGWAIGQFTPWATNDSTGMMADFYTTLNAALPEQPTNKLREGLGILARVGAPALKLIPYAGDVAAEAATQAADRMLRQPSWDKAFREVSASLQAMATPVLIVVDDVDRLQQGELLDLLKVIRLLGRFPGVSYLLAYDEQTLFGNLERADVGTGTREGARLYLEKIVQHPMAMPPMLESQVLQQVSHGLDKLLSTLGRSAIESDSRLNMTTDSLVAQLSTPRAISRYLAQVRLTLSMHDAAEINDVDIILITLIRVQFPDLYAELRRWKPELTGGRSDRAVMKSVGEKDWGQMPIDFAPLWETVPKGPTREDAQEVMAQLFPATSRYQGSSAVQLGASERDYFDRYFIHSVPSDEASNTALLAALDEAGTAGAGVVRLRALLRDRTPAQASVAIRRLRAVFEANPREGVDTLSLLGGILDVLDDAPKAHSVLLDATLRLTYWASHLISKLPATVSAADLETALERCKTTDRILTVLRGTREEQPLPVALGEVVQRYSEQCLSDVIEHLRQGDTASLEMLCHFNLLFITEFGDTARAKGRIASLLDREVTTEVLASRCVTVSHWIGVHPPQGMIRTFDQETFALFAPADDALYRTSVVDDVDIYDLSWSNRRAFVHGRATSPTVATESPIA